MQTFRIIATHNRGLATESVGHFTLQAPTRGDAIIQAQKEMARLYGLTRTEEALVRVEFEQP